MNLSLKKVKGISPRYYFERHVIGRKFDGVLNAVMR